MILNKISPMLLTFPTSWFTIELLLTKQETMREIKIQFQPSFNQFGNQYELIKIGRILEQGYVIPGDCDKIVVNKTLQGAGKNRYVRVIFYKGSKYIEGFNL